MKRILCLFTALLVLLAGCAPAAGNAAPTASSPAAASQTAAAQSSGGKALADKYVAPQNDNVITFADGSATYNGTGGVQIDGGTVTVTAPGVYTLTGALEHGQLVVNATAKGAVTLVCNGVSLTNEDSAALWVQQASETVLALADGTQNSISGGADAQTTDDAAPKAALFSADDLWLCGAGALTVNAPGGNGIQSKDTLTLANGVYTIDAANNGLVGKDSLTCGGGSYHITAGNDGMKSTEQDDASLGTVTLLDGDYVLDTQGDAVQAETLLEVYGGAYTVTTGGGAQNAAAHTQNGNFGKGGGMMGAAPPDSAGTLPEGGTPPARPNATTAADSGTGMRTAINETAAANTATAAQATIATQAADTAVTATTAATATTEESDSRKAFKAGMQLHLYGGTYMLDACDDAFHSNGSLTVSGGTYTIATGDDAFHADETLTVSGGSIDITASYEGLEGYDVLISGGDVSIVSSDDGVNAAGGDGSGQYGFAQDAVRGSSGGAHLTISGGTLTVDAGGDGLDINGSAEMTGGAVTVYGPENGGNGALDYDGSFTVSGGTLLTLGYSQMSLTPTAQDGALLCVYGTFSAGQALAVHAQDGTQLAAVTLPKSAQHLLVFSPALTVGSTVTATADGAALGEVTLQQGTNTLGNAPQGGIGGMGGGKGARQAAAA